MYMFPIVFLRIIVLPPPLFSNIDIFFCQAVLCLLVPVLQIRYLRLVTWELFRTAMVT